MKKWSLIITALFILAGTAAAQNYKLVKVNVNDETVRNKLLLTGIDLEETYLDKSGNLEIYVSDYEYQQIIAAGISPQVIINDWNEYYSSIPKLTEAEKQAFINDSRERFGVEGFGYGSMGGFYTYQEAIAQLDSAFARFPNIATQKILLGTTEQGRSIWGIKISDNPNMVENEPRVLFDALIHAREPISGMTVLYYMYYLLENYGTNPEVTYLVDNREIYIVPVFNPDGYEYNRQTNPNGGGMWRKNRRNNGDGSYGVDLNRNFGYMWGYDNVGSSNTPSSETYRGPSAFSEPETQVIRNLAEPRNFKTYINYHSYNNSMIYPWGYINQVTPDNATFVEFTSYMSRYNGFDYGTSYQTLGYNSNGTARDYMYGEQTTKGKAYGYTFEVGASSDGFWPSQSRIFPLVQLNLRPNLYKTWLAGEYVSLKSPGYDKQYFNPGDLVTMSPVLKNQGLSTGYNLTTSIESLSPLLTTGTASAQADSISARGEKTLTNALTFAISPNATVADRPKFVFKVFTGANIMSSDTITLSIGTPVYTLLDSANNPLTNWTVTANPATPKWESTNTTYVSSPNSFTDSKTGNYASNATVTLQLTNPVNLGALTAPKLTFWTKYDMEANWDYGQVSVSTNGGSAWTALAGLYTEPGTGSFQPPGQPLYDGVRSDWVREEMDLANYSANSLIRFQLRTDGSQVRDGWYLDDIGIYSLQIVPVELTGLSCTVNENGALVQWSTVSELNNRGFEIEKSADQISWQKMAFIEGKGTTQEKSNYSWNDKTPLAGKSYYRIKQHDYDGTYVIYGPVEAENSFRPFDFMLTQNYPNPFNPKTRIAYYLPEKSEVKLTVFDALGNEVASLVNEIKDAGAHYAEFDGANLASGIYIYKIEAGSFTKTMKMTLLK